MKCFVEYLKSLTPCLSHNMQRRAFIIFIKTIFLGSFCQETLFPLWSQFRCRDTPLLAVLISLAFFVRRASLRRISCLCSCGPASKHPSSAASDLKNDPSHVTRTEFLCYCLRAFLLYATLVNQLCAGEQTFSIANVPTIESFFFSSTSRFLRLFFDKILIF